MRCRSWRLPASRRVRETALQELRSKRLEGFLECSFPARTATHARDFQSNGLGFLTGEWIAITWLVVQGETLGPITPLRAGGRSIFTFKCAFPKHLPTPSPRPLAFRLPGAAAKQAQTRFSVIKPFSIPRTSSHASRRNSRVVGRLTRQVGPSQPVDTHAARGPRKACDPFARQAGGAPACQFPRVPPTEGSIGAQAQWRNGFSPFFSPSYHK
jgi:hypothetical protein